jgi:hypothetical protein
MRRSWTNSDQTRDERSRNNSDVAGEWGEGETIQIRPGIKEAETNQMRLGNVAKAKQFRSDQG